MKCYFHFKAWYLKSLSCRSGPFQILSNKSVHRKITISQNDYRYRVKYSAGPSNRRVRKQVRCVIVRGFRRKPSGVNIAQTVCYWHGNDYGAREGGDWTCVVDTSNWYRGSALESIPWGGTRRRAAIVSRARTSPQLL